MAKFKNDKTVNENNELNIVWFICAALIVFFLFFLFRYWFKGEPYQPYVPRHLRQKVQIKVYESENKRQAKGYNLAY